MGAGIDKTVILKPNANLKHDKVSIILKILLQFYCFYLHSRIAFSLYMTVYNFKFLE